jgi:hypothetical protein
MALILRRNEAERKKTQRKIKSTILYSNSACTLPKGLPTSQSQKTQASHLILLSFLSFCIFFLFFPRLRNRASTGLGQRQVTLYSFSCTYLPEAPLAWACKALSTAPLLDWIITSFSHDQKKTLTLFFVSLGIFWFLFFS